MINFKKFTLDNGLRVLIHEDSSTPMAVLNILYDVGARDEDPEQTGFAHLFEHLMFGGSINIPDYDTPLQKVGGENNAFTSNDITNYYITLPAENLETACWLESDRMLSLAFNQKSLDIQKQVVVEEFKQRYLNQPYGDVWLNLRPLAYQKHPYRWATIGKELKHIEDAKMEDVKAFFEKHYHPANAILVVGGNIQTEEALELIKKWFGDIPAKLKNIRNLPQEPVQTEARKNILYADVPSNGIYIAFHGVDRMHEDYHAMDLLTDLLSRGQSSRLYQKLVKENSLFSELQCYITGSIDPNLVVFEGKLLPHITFEEAEKAIWNEIEDLKQNLVNEKELLKVKNKTESILAFSEMSLLDKAMNLAYFELLGDANLINEERNQYLKVQAEDIKRVAETLLRLENSSTLLYYAKKDEDK